MLRNAVFGIALALAGIAQGAAAAEKRNQELEQALQSERLSEKEPELSPDLQFIRRPGGNAAAPNATVVGLRAKVGF